MGRYLPAAGAHAIEHAIVGLRLFAQAEEPVFQEAIGVAAELAKKHNLPGRLHLDPFSLAFGRQVITNGFAPPVAMAHGTLFQRVKSDGSMEEELTVERNAVTFRTNAYTRWSVVSGLISDVLTPIGKILAGGDAAKLAVIELRCIDKFTAPDEPAPPLGDLVRAGSPYIADGMLEKSEQLHIHSGWFEDQSPEGRTLVNFNIDVVDDEAQGTRSASILQVLSMHSAEGLFSQYADFDAAIGAAFANLHKRDKRLLSAIITDDMQAAINLVGDSGI